MRYLGVAHHDRPDGPFGVTVPDPPGRFSAGATLDDPLNRAVRRRRRPHVLESAGSVRPGQHLEGCRS